ncbi:outer membrane lipoprotein, partial [Haemophilus influenzae]
FYSHKNRLFLNKLSIVKNQIKKFITCDLFSNTLSCASFS